MVDSIVVENASKEFTMRYHRTLKQMSIALLRGKDLSDRFMAVLPLMKKLGLPSTARASFYLYNTEAELAALAAALRKVVKFFG